MKTKTHIKSGSASSEASKSQLSGGYGADMWLDVELPSR
jgi:hypothetical protein